MGFLDMFKKSKQGDIQPAENKNIVSPTNGEILDISLVPDEVFSQKMMGDGFAIKSSDGNIVSPINGTVEMVFETKHAIGLKSNDEMEMLIHLGIDTVNLKGEGFTTFVKAGDKVKVGDKLIHMNVDFIKNNAKSDISPIIFTNLKDNEYVKVVTGKVSALEENRIEICK